MIATVATLVVDISVNYEDVDVLPPVLVNAFLLASILDGAVRSFPYVLVLTDFDRNALLYHHLATIQRIRTQR